MGVFVDAKGKVIKRITERNVVDYKKWLLSDENPQCNGLSVDKKVPLADLAVSDDLNYEQTQAVAGLITKTLRPSNKERLNELIDLAKQNPKIAMSSYLKTTGTVPYAISLVLDERPSSENLAFGLAFLDCGGWIGNVGKADDFAQISAENKKYAEKLLDLASTYYSLKKVTPEDRKFDLAEDYVTILMRKGSLVNLETDDKRRTFLDRMIYTHYESIREGIFNVLDAKYIGAPLLSKMVHFYGAKPELKDTNEAVTQAEKNINILPKGYSTLKQALWNLLEQEAYGPSDSWGRTSGFNEKYKFYCRVWNISSALYGMPCVLGGLYKETAKKDIERSGLKHLDSTALDCALRDDDAEKYYKMLSEDDKQYIDDRLYLFSPEFQRRHFLFGLDKDNLSTTYVKLLNYYSANYDSRENKKILVRLDKEQAKIAREIQQLKRKMAETVKLNKLLELRTVIEETRSAVFARELKKRKLAKELVGVPDKSAVQLVEQNATKDEKVQIRSWNKQIEDKLAVKEKVLAGKTEYEKVDIQKERLSSQGVIFKNKSMFRYLTYE